MKLKHIFIIFILSTYIASSATERITNKLSLNEAISIGLDNNKEISVSELNKKLSSLNYQKSISLYLPRLTVSNSFIRTDDPLANFGYKLSQKNVTAADFNPDLLNDPGMISNINSNILLEQPIFNIDGYYQRVAARKVKKADEFMHKFKTNYVTLKIKQAYFFYILALKQQKSINTLLESAKSNLELAKNHLNQGYITKAELLAAEIGVLNTERKQKEVENNVENSRNRLSLVTGTEISRSVILTDTLFENSDLNLNKQFDINNRADLMAASKKIEVMQSLRKSSVSKLIPNVNAFASLNYNDSDYGTLSNKNSMLGVSLKWKLFNGYSNIADIKKNKVEVLKAKKEYDQHLENSNLQIEESKREFNLMKKNINLSKKIVSQSAESLRIIKNRYKQGLEKTVDLLNAQSNHTNHIINYLNTLYAYNMAYYKLEMLTTIN